MTEGYSDADNRDNNTAEQTMSDRDRDRDRYDANKRNDGPFLLIESIIVGPKNVSTGTPLDGASQSG